VVREKIANPLGKWLMGHREEVEAAIKKDGAVKLTINSLDNLGAVDAAGKPLNEPVLTKADVAAPSNDNAATPPKTTFKRAAPKA
jgi:hypothetical protein